jgi:amino acid adenylation domain-containing protein
VTTRRLHHLIEAQVRRTPAAVAVYYESDALSYAELNQPADALAHRLRACGVGPEVIVGVRMQRTPDLVVALLGVLKAGGAYLPLDPAYPAERLAFMLADAQASLLITDTGVERIGAPRAAGAPSGASNLAYLIYTSGSTGRPKGVMIEHRNALAFLDWATRFFSPAELQRVLGSTSVCFDLSIFELFAPLAVGGSVVLVKDALQLAAGAGRDITLLNTVPSALRELVQLGAIPPSVRTINVAGEPLPNALAQQAYTLEHIQRVVNLYGPTEDTTYSTVSVVERGASEPPSIGRPIDGTAVVILDPHQELAAPGASGELYIGGAGVARGYLGRPELTAERFIADPFSSSPGARLYRTGDRVRWRADGQLEFLGRLDRQIKLRGYRIELGEIEAALAAVPSVSAGVVLLREDSPGQARLVAYVVAPPETDLRLELARALPEYMVPTVFVRLEALPLTPNGKVDRAALPAPLAQPSDDTHEPPSTDTERLLADIWSDVLGLPHVGRHANFFDLGGYSLKAFQVMARVRSTFGVEVPAHSLFGAPSVAQLAGLIADQQFAQADPDLIARLLQEIT